MKNILFLFAITLAIISCKQEGCTYADANNYDPAAEKDDGSCDYTDLTPEPDPREVYTGSYLVKDSAFLDNSFYEIQDYTLLVTYENTISDTLYFKNLWNDGATYLVVLTGNSFSMPSQQVSGPYYASGSGSIINGAIEYTTSGDVYLNKGKGEKQ
ncbi:MAG: hypothetical protein AB8B72_00355 [Crocinitomicaceae bacterium]